MVAITNWVRTARGGATSGFALNLGAVTLALAALVAMQLVALAVIKGLVPSALNQDVAWMLYGGQVLLDGGRYGIDVVDPNPPLVFWISAGVVAGARLLDTTPQLAFNLFVIGVVILSVLLCHSIYTRRAVSGHQAWLVSVLFAVAMVVPAGRDFGQRDHLAVVMVMPYLFALGSRLDGHPASRGLGAWAGALAGIGIALKPYFLLMWVVPEAYATSRRGLQHRWPRQESVAVLAIQLLYAALIVGFAPEYLQTTRQLLGYQDAYGNPIPLENPATPYLLMAIGLTLVMRPARPDVHLRRILLLNVFACAAILILQAKGFRYHYVPVYVACLCLASVIVLGSPTAAVVGGLVVRVPITAVACALVLLGSVATGIHGRNVLRHQNDQVEALRNAVELYAADGTILVVSSTVPPAFPLVNLSGTTWSSRYSCQWLVPASYTGTQRGASPFAYRHVHEMPELERRALDHLMEDLHKRPPALILLPSGPVWPMTGSFDWSEYLHHDPRFVEFLGEYRHVGETGGHHLYARPSLPSR